MNNFCIAILCFLLTVCNVLAASDTPHCAKDADGFLECLNSEHDKNKEDDTKKLNKIGSRIEKCFKDNGCPPPSNSTTHLAQLNVETAWKEFPKAAITCLKTAYRSLAVKVINGCLKEQKVDEIKEYNSEDHELDEFTNKTLPHVRFARGLLKVALALADCRSEISAKAANNTVTCLSTVKEDVKEAICKRVDKCRKDKVSDTCHQQGQKIKKALCTCGREKLKSIIKSVEDFEKKDDNVQVKEIIKSICKTCEDDHKTMKDNVTQCFKDKKVFTEWKGYEVDIVIDGLTDYLSFAVHDPTGPAHAVLGLFLNIDGSYATKNELSEVRGVLNDILNNVDCGCS